MNPKIMEESAPFFFYQNPPTFSPTRPTLPSPTGHLPMHPCTCLSNSSCSSKGHPTYWLKPPHSYFPPPALLIPPSYASHQPTPCPPLTSPPTGVPLPRRAYHSPFWRSEPSTSRLGPPTEPPPNLLLSACHLPHPPPDTQRLCSIF